MLLKIGQIGVGGGVRKHVRKLLLLLLVLDLLKRILQVVPFSLGLENQGEIIISDALDERGVEARRK